MSTGRPDDKAPKSPGAGDQVRWEIPVFDAVLLRPRVLVIEVAEMRVVVVPPPGEGFVVPAESIRPLRDALNAAHSVADHRRRGYRREQS